MFTTDGVVLPPSEFGIIEKFPPSITATQLFVVPKSIPIILLIFITPVLFLNFLFIFFIKLKTISY